MAQLELNSDFGDDPVDLVTYFAEIILPLPLPASYTYRVPRQLEDSVLVGGRVIVQFGKTKIYTGVVKEIHENPPKGYEAKYILDCLDEEPTLNEIQLKFFQWIAGYYMCTLGEVVNAAIPSGLKLSNESFLQLNPGGEESAHEFTEKEERVIEQLKKVERMTYQDVSDLLGIKLIHPVVKSLVQKEAVLIFDKIKDKFVPKKERIIEFGAKYKGNQPALEVLFEDLEKKPKQLDVLLKYLSLTGFDQGDETSGSSASKKELLSTGVSASSLKTLVANEVFVEFDRISPRFDYSPSTPEHDIILSSAQQDCLDEITGAFQKNKPVLFHGITGSGKTEIYVELIRQVLSEGGQVLYLLPEIALTTQIVNRLNRLFGSQLGVYHSRYSDNERVEIWNDVKSGKLSFVAGVRSSVFLPFSDLSLIIVDEEHDSSYKQYDPAPRYNARDAALWMARAHGARILLGSATPAIESYQNARDEKYVLVSLTERYGEASLPEFAFANTLTARNSKRMKGDFTPELIEEIGHTLERNEQVIIFQNRRGYAPYLSCDHCNHVPKCQNCDVSLTYHMHAHLLVCHYCGHKEPVLTECPACGSNSLRTVGYGTEKLEDDLKILFPEARIQRMDQDTTRSRSSYQTIIDRFEQGQTDILVGTQMLSKGLHFDKVSLVGILDFDRMVHFPDFRSYERAFQLITQVAGRSGRKIKGKVVVQTGEPENTLLHKIKAGDYLSFFQTEVLERENFSYPPYHRLIKVTLKHKEPQKLKSASKDLAERLYAELGRERVLGPQQPIIGRIRNLYLEEIWIKMEKKVASFHKIKLLIYRLSNKLKENKEYNQLLIVFDVDPV